MLVAEVTTTRTNTEGAIAVRIHRMKKYIRDHYQPLFQAIGAGDSLSGRVAGGGWLKVDAELRRFIALHLGEAPHPAGMGVILMHFFWCWC